MKQNSKKLLYSLYAAGAVLGASMLSGCQQTRYIYVNPDGSSYTPSYNSSTYTPANNNHVGGEIIRGVLMGLGGL